MPIYINEINQFEHNTNHNVNTYELEVFSGYVFELKTSRYTSYSKTVSSENSLTVSQFFLLYLSCISFNASY